MDVDRSVASATARSSGNFDRSEDANGYHVSSHGRNGRQGNVGKSFRSLFKVSEPLLHKISGPLCSNSGKCTCA